MFSLRPLDDDAATDDDQRSSESKQTSEVSAASLLGCSSMGIRRNRSKKRLFTRAKVKKKKKVKDAQN